MKILVLGANGQVGSELGAQLDSLARLEGERFTVVFANRSSVDVTNLDSLKSFLGHHEPKWVINATAYTAVDSAESEVSKAYSVNEHAVRVLANYCATNDANLIHISTDYVFDGSGELPFHEESEMAPLGVYGASKPGEEAVRATMQRYIIFENVLVFGASGNNFVKNNAALGEKPGPELGVVGDQFGAPTSARGIAKAIASVISTMSAAGSGDKRWGTYHYSGQPFVSWAEFANEIFLQAKDLGESTVC